MGAKVGSYWSLPLRGFPLTQWRSPSFQMDGMSVGLTDGAKTDRKISVPGGSSEIGIGFVKTSYVEFLSYCSDAVSFH